MFLIWWKSSAVWCGRVLATFCTSCCGERWTGKHGSMLPLSGSIEWGYHWVERPPHSSPRRQFLHCLPPGAPGVYWEQYEMALRPICPPVSSLESVSVSWADFLHKLHTSFLPLYCDLWHSHIALKCSRGRFSPLVSVSVTYQGAVY